MSVLEGTLCLAAVMTGLCTMWLVASKCDFSFLFAYHPVLMVASFGLLLPVGVSAVRLRHSAKKIEDRVWFLQTHIAAQLIGGVLATIGFAAIYLNKTRHNKNHFTSWHGFIGCIAFVVVLVNVVTGMLRSASRRHTKYPMLWKSALHRASGAAAVLIGAAALYLGFESNWAQRNLGGGSSSYLGMLVFAVIGALVTLPSIVRFAS